MNLNDSLFVNDNPSIIFGYIIMRLNTFSTCWESLNDIIPWILIFSSKFVINDSPSILFTISVGMYT